MSEPITPLFVLSLPRSGSTLVQRVLAVDPAVATASEPWILLPLLSVLRPRLPQGGRWHAQVADAVSDFARELPDGLDAYRAAVRTAALELYREAAGPGPRFFLDKTPPYTLLGDELLDVFPSARVLVLWRHPLAVVSSIVDTFCDGRWAAADYATSLFTGIETLTTITRRHPDRVVPVRYEDLLTGGEPVWRATAAALGVPFDPAALERFGDVRLDGRLGDPTGVRAYAALDRRPLDKWRVTVDSPVRRAWCRRYLRWIGRERLALMGYDLDELLGELDSLRGGALEDAARDAAQLAASFARDAVKAQVLRDGRPPSSWRYLLATA